MSNDWLANKMTMLAKEVERNKNDEFISISGRRHRPQAFCITKW